MKTLLKFCACAAIIFAATSIVSCSDDDDNNSGPVPEAFIEALKAVDPAAYNVKWDMEGAWRVAEYRKAGVETEVWFDAMAAWVMTEKDFGKDWFLVPDNAVNTAFANGEYGMWTVDDIKYYLQTTDEFYVIEVEMPGQPDMDLFYTKTGTMIKAVPSSATGDILPNTVISK